MKNCIFCKIVRGEVPSAKIWENKNFLAFLDIRPKTEGMTVLITKEHFDSEVFNMPPDLHSAFFTAAKKTAGLLKESLGAERVFLVKEGADVNHAHLKLYPVKSESIVLGQVLARRTETKDSQELKKKAEEIRKQNS